MIQLKWSLKVALPLLFMSWSSVSFANGTDYADNHYQPVERSSDYEEHRRDRGRYHDDDRDWRRDRRGRSDRNRRRYPRNEPRCEVPSDIRIGRCVMTPERRVFRDFVEPGTEITYVDRRRSTRAWATLRCERGTMVVVRDNNRDCFGRRR